MRVQEGPALVLRAKEQHRCVRVAVTFLSSYSWGESLSRLGLPFAELGAFSSVAGRLQPERR